MFLGRWRRGSCRGGLLLHWIEQERERDGGGGDGLGGDARYVWIFDVLLTGRRVPYEF